MSARGKLEMPLEETTRPVQGPPARARRFAREAAAALRPSGPVAAGRALEERAAKVLRERRNRPPAGPRRIPNS